jgi:hypothetical protein
MREVERELLLQTSQLKTVTTALDLVFGTLELLGLFSDLEAKIHVYLYL